MEGTLTPAGGGASSPFRFSLTGKAGLEQMLADGRVEIEGTVEAPQIAGQAAMRGEMFIRPAMGYVSYEFEFTGDDGRVYRFSGEKTLKLADLIGSWTRLPGTITDDSGQIVANCETRFDLRRDWLTLLTSIRLGF
jgi:hypothetical protein